MDKSDLDSFQNIIVTGTHADSATISPVITNSVTGANRHNSALNSSASRLSLYSTHQTCQICGVLLKLDANIQQMNENTYRQLSNPFSSGIRDDLDTTISGNIDADMEISLSALVGASGLTGLGIDKSLVTNLEELDINVGGGASRKSYEPAYRKSMIPPHLYYPQTSLETQLNVQHNELGWSARVNEISALFDIMSSNTPIDHPLCEECADQLVNQLDAQCKLVEMEHADYTALINRLNQQINNESEVAMLEKDLKQLEVEEQELLSKLGESERTEADLVKKKETLLVEENTLMQQEQHCLLEYSNFKRQLIRLEEKQESLDNQLRNAKFHFYRLRTVNVLNATFHIWHSGPFGTINYFRLGHLPGIPVEWEEINAGLGQANLLLYCLARNVKLEFKRFRLVPYGSYSYIEVIENTTGYKVGDELNMYRLKGLKYFFDWDKKFEKGMCAFLDCLRQFEDKIKSLDPQFAMPYRINGHKLEDKNASSYSIKFQLNSFEEWTKALKYMLTNLKWSLAWVTAMQNDPTSIS